MTTTSDPDADIDLGELVGSEDEDGLVELRPEDLGGEQLERLAVDTDQALSRVSKQKSVPVAFFFLPNT